MEFPLFWLNDWDNLHFRKHKAVRVRLQIEERSVLTIQGHGLSMRALWAAKPEIPLLEPWPGMLVNIGIWSASPTGLDVIV